MDKKFSASNRDKIVKSLKYHIERKIPNFKGSTNDLRELVFESSRKIHTENPGLDIKDFNKKVLTESFNVTQSMSSRKKSQPRKFIQASTPSDITNQVPQNVNISTNGAPNFKLQKDEPLEDPMKELQRLQSSRNLMDEELNQPAEKMAKPLKTNIRNTAERKSNNTKNINTVFSNLSNIPEDEGEAGGLESLFSTILPPEQMKIDNRPNVKTISIQDQTFRKRKTEQLDRDAIIQSKPAKNREQELIIPRTIQQGYYDKEHTLVIYGLDRNWINMEENRYHFNLKFQSKDNGTNSVRGLGNAKTDDTYRNIVGMQIAGLILPNENLSTMVELPNRNSTDTSRDLNVLQYPYVNVNIGTFNGEIQGTNTEINQSFGNMKFDTTIRSDTTNVSSGFFSFIPTDNTQKRIFYPTPLANLKSMNISITNPIGNLLSEEKDCIDIEKIYIANTDISAECPGGPLLADLSNSIPYIDVESDPTEVASINYLILKTKNFFRAEHIQKGDIIQITNFDVPENTDSLPAITGTLEESTGVAFETFINRKKGHHVIDVGHYQNVDYDISESGALVSGGNMVGYANYIVIQTELNDPESGSILRKLFGNSEAQDYLLHQHMSLYNQDNSCLVNTSKQLQIIFKIFTRNYDSSELKPQNI